MKVILLLAVLLLASQAFSQSAVVRSDNTKLRGTPAASGKIVETLWAKARVEVIRERGQWVLVQTDEYVGWLLARELDRPITPDGEATEPAATKAPPPPTRTAAAGERTYLRGPRGGCYYLNDSGRKVYVDHSKCE